MTSTDKSFEYFFNTPSGDYTAARVLSGRNPDTVVSLPSLDVFDSDTQTKLQAVATTLINASHGLTNPQYNVNGRVLGTLITYLMRHYSSLKRFKKDDL